MTLTISEYAILKAAMENPNGEVDINPRDHNSEEAKIAWELERKKYLQNSGDIFYITPYGREALMIEEETRARG